MANKLTVILPAAGKGTRLNLPYPKEILRVNFDKALIDYSFDLFHDVGYENVEFVVIINEDKTEIVKYLSKYADKFKISFTYQDPNQLEYTGAIKSAAHLFGDFNVVLLPDTIITLPEGDSMHELVMRKLSENNFTFLFKSENDNHMLATKGCLKINEDMLVTKYEDKPTISDPDYDGYWCGFGFRKEVFQSCIKFMEQSTLKLKEPSLLIENTPIFHAPVIRVDQYKDLGTWDEINRLLSIPL